MAKSENKTNNEKKQSKDTKTKVTQSKGQKTIQDSKKEKQANTRSKKRMFSYVVTGAVAIVVIAVLILAFYNFNPTSFATFKSNFNSAQRIAIASQYINGSDYANISQCSTDLVHAETSSLKRNASTIDFYVLNATSCTYAPNGLGHVLNPVTTNASSCQKSIASEPTISLNYSTYNHTIITPDHLTVYGTSKYFAQCEIAISIV